MEVTTLVDPSEIETIDPKSRTSEHGAVVVVGAEVDANLGIHE